MEEAVYAEGKKDRKSIEAVEPDLMSVERTSPSDTAAKTMVVSQMCMVVCCEGYDEGAQQACLPFQFRSSACSVSVAWYYQLGASKTSMPQASGKQHSSQAQLGRIPKQAGRQ